MKHSYFMTIFIIDTLCKACLKYQGLLRRKGDKLIFSSQQRSRRGKSWGKAREKSAIWIKGWAPSRAPQPFHTAYNRNKEAFAIHVIYGALRCSMGIFIMIMKVCGRRMRHHVKRKQSITVGLNPWLHLLSSFSLASICGSIHFQRLPYLDKGFDCRLP